MQAATDISIRRLPRWGATGYLRNESPKYTLRAEAKFRSHALTIVDDDPLSPFGALRDARDAVAEHDVLRRIASGTLSVASLRRVLIALYPMLNAYVDLSEQTRRNVRANSWAERELERWLRCSLRTTRQYPRRYREFAEAMGVAGDALVAEPQESMKTMLGLAWQRQNGADVGLSLAISELGLGWTLGEFAGALVLGYPGHRESFDSRFEPARRRKQTREAAAHIARASAGDVELRTVVDATKRTLELAKTVLDTATRLPSRP